MGASRRAALAIVASALSFTLPAAAQPQGNQAAAASNPSGARTMAPGADRRKDRNNREVASRMTRIPEFVEALRNGDANAAKRIFVANGGSADQVILVPVRGWNPTTGYNASEPFPPGTPNHTPVCEFYYVIPWGWNYLTEKWSGYMYVCRTPAKEGYVGYL